MIDIRRIATDEASFEEVRRIRQEVFCVEQGVSEADEFDEYETVSRHFLATYQGQPAGAARWRRTDKGVKLERFAVVAPHRQKGVGSALVKAVLDDIGQQPGLQDAYLYMHAQLPAIPLYERFGFAKTGPEFEECGIRHYKMHQGGQAQR